MEIVNIYIVYEINKNFDINTLENCFFGAFKFGIGFNRKGFFSLGNGIGRNV